MIDKFRPRFSSSSHAFNSCEWRKASKKQCPGTNGADGTGTYPADLMNVSCAALSTTLPGKTLSRSSTSLSPSKSAALRLRLLVLVCFGTAAFPLPPLFLVVVAVAVTARLEVARGAAAEEDDDDDDDDNEQQQEEEEEEEEEERDGKNGAVCCDE